jgi:subtilase family serine protease
MFIGRTLIRHTGSLGLVLAAGAFLFAPAIHAQQEAAQPPEIASRAISRGLALPNEELNLTVHLQPHNEAAYDAAVQALYTEGSPTYHHWFTASDFAKYAPSAAELATVKKELESHGLAITGSDPDNYYLRVHGTVAGVESAFHTQIGNFEYEGKTFRANTTPAKLQGPAAPLVSAVSGLSSFGMKKMVKFQINPRTHLAPKITRAQAASGLGQYFTNKCFQSPATLSFTTAGASLPVGQYYGNRYDVGTLTCGWTPSQLQAHYGVNTAISSGLNGKGETIVIIDGPSDPTVQADAVVFAQATGLPAVTSSNFQLIYPDGVPTQFELTEITNWDDEADLDIQWSHAFAPGAKIDLLITPTEDWTEFEYAIQYAVENKLGHVISNSYGYPELAWGAATLKGFDAVLKKAAAAGVAVNFSSGDSGDVGTGEPNGGGASYPASSTYATSVGGTSIDIPTVSGGIADPGWGNNAAIISFATNSVLDPPIGLGFQGGAGGGESTFITKPSWQSGIAGKGRQQPDIAEAADPYTGAVFVFDGDFSVIGGTSLASPIFSAIWTLADQKAGVPLGQAAPLIATLGSSALRDIVPVGSPTNPAGIVFDTAGSTYYSADSLLAPIFTSTTNYSAVWDLGGGYDAIISFGTDTSLATAKGWDNVTGWGVPNGTTFINAAAAKK